MNISGIGMQINSVVCTADIGMLTMQVWWYANKKRGGGSIGIFGVGMLGMPTDGPISL